MSHFGADIFDDEPPSKPPARKPRKPAKAAAEVAPAEPEAPAGSEPQTDAPKKRRSPRKKPAAEDATSAQPTPSPASEAPPARPARGEDLGDVVFPARGAQAAQKKAAQPAPEPEPSAQAESAASDAAQAETGTGDRDDRRRRRGRGRNRRERDEGAAPTDRADSSEPYDNPFAKAQRETDRPAAHSQAPSQPIADATDGPEMDELGEGFGDIPHDDAEAELGGAPAEAGTFPSFSDGRRRRRRRRGRRGREDDRPDARDANQAAPFPRAQGDEVRHEPQSRPFPQDPAAQQPQPWREDRPRREGHDRGRDARHRHDSFDRDEDRAPRQTRRPHADFKPATPPPEAPAARRIAILLDLAGLQREAQSLGAEVAFRKLRAAIAGHDEVVHAVCFLPPDLPETARKLLQSTGFTLEEAADADSASAAIVQHATHGDWPVDAIVIAGAPNLAARVGRPEGAVIEAADFAGTERTDEPSRPLGRNCLFVP